MILSLFMVLILVNAAEKASPSILVEPPPRPPPIPPSVKVTHVFISPSRTTGWNWTVQITLIFRVKC